MQNHYVGLLRKKMTPIWNAFWEALEDTVKYHQKKDTAVVLDNSQIDLFKTKATTLYNSIKDRYMNQSLDNLDRHKVAAVMIVSAIECEVVKYNAPLPLGHVFLGCEMFSAEVALSWMLQCVNEKLKQGGETTEIAEYFMPEAFACKTSYFEIFSRNLYFSKKYYTLNPLSIAENLFLLEYLTITKNDINTTTLHET